MPTLTVNDSAPCSVGRRCSCDRLAHALGERERPFAIDAARDQRELLAAVAREHVFLARSSVSALATSAAPRRPPHGRACR